MAQSRRLVNAGDLPAWSSETQILSCLFEKGPRAWGRRGSGRFGAGNATSLYRDTEAHYGVPPGNTVPRRTVSQ